ncbi:MAG: PHP domain-containing protein [Candidatus Firestonebacteria bacterium]
MKIFRLKLSLVFILLFLLRSVCFGFEQTDKRITAIFHVHSNISYNCEESIEEITNKAKLKNIDAIFFTDHDFIKLEYKPLFGSMKITISKPSVFKFGVTRYYDLIEETNKKYPEMFLFPGVESSPYYYWKNESNTITIKDWHKHLIVFGLKQEDLKNIPVIPNGKVFPLNLLLLWPIIFIIVGAFFIRRIVFRRLGIILVVIGIWILYINYPFTQKKYDQYSKINTIKPYQDVIDYIHNKNGFIFWAHPEAENNNEIINNISLGFKFLHLKIKMETKPYYDDLLNTYGYTGFAYFWEGEKK